MLTNVLPNVAKRCHDVAKQINNTKINNKRDIKIHQNNDNLSTRFICLLCNKNYIDRTGLYRHKKKKHPNYEEDVKKKNSEIEQLKNEVDELKKRSNHSNIINSNNRNLVINNILNFGEEKMIQLSENEKQLILQDPSKSIYELAKLIYCNQNVPENSTTLVNNLTSKFLYIKKDKKLLADNKCKIIPIIANRTSEYLRNYISTIHTLIPDKIKAYRTVCDFHKSLTKSNMKYTKNIFDNYDTLLYNNRDIVSMNMNNPIASKMLVDNKIEHDENNPMYIVKKEKEMKEIFKDITPDIIKEFAEKTQYMTTDELVQFTLDKYSQ